MAFYTGLRGSRVGRVALRTFHSVGGHAGGSDAMTAKTRVPSKKRPGEPYYTTAGACAYSKDRASYGCSQIKKGDSMKSRPKISPREGKDRLSRTATSVKENSRAYPFLRRPLDGLDPAGFEPASSPSQGEMLPITPRALGISYRAVTLPHRYEYVPATDFNPMTTSPMLRGLAGRGGIDGALGKYFSGVVVDGFGLGD